MNNSKDTCPTIECRKGGLYAIKCCKCGESADWINPLHLFFCNKCLAIQESQSNKPDIENQIVWKDFDCDNEDLENHKRYNVRFFWENASPSSPVMAYWKDDEKAFFLLDANVSTKLCVDQYFQIPE